MNTFCLTEATITASFPFREWREMTVLVSGASKSFSWTGGRIGWALFPTVEEAEIFRNLNINYFSCIPPYNQEGARVALESPLSEEAIRQMVEAFQQRRDVVVKGLNAIEGIRCQNPKRGLLCFPEYQRGLQEPWNF